MGFIVVGMFAAGMAQLGLCEQYTAFTRCLDISRAGDGTGNLLPLSSTLRFNRRFSAAIAVIKPSCVASGECGRFGRRLFLPFPAPDTGRSNALWRRSGAALVRLLVLAFVDLRCAALAGIHSVRLSQGLLDLCNSARGRRML